MSEIITSGVSLALRMLKLMETIDSSSRNWSRYVLWGLRGVDLTRQAIAYINKSSI